MTLRGRETSRSPRRWLTGGGLAGVGLWVLTGPACGSGPPIAPTDVQSGGGGGAVGSSSATGASSTASSSGTGAGTPGDCPSAPIPEGVPDGWLEWADWSCDCRMYIPGPDAVLPPITWAACPDAPAEVDCEALATDSLDGLPGFIGAGIPGPGMDVGADGKATLQLFRAVPDHHTMFLVADAQGPVHTAVLRPHPGITDHAQTGCGLYGQDINEGRHLLLAKGANAAGVDQSDDSGAFGGAIGAGLPTLLHHFEGAGTPSWRAGAQWLARLLPGLVFTAHPWDMSEEHFVTSTATDPDGYKVTQPFVSGDAVFWMAGGSLYGGGLMVWDAKPRHPQFRSLAR